MKFEWNYFEPRVIGFGVELVAHACKINEDKSLSYWVEDSEEGMKLITFTCEDEE